MLLVSGYNDLQETKVKTSENHGIKNKNELKVVNSKRELKYSEVLKIDNENKTNSEISAEKEVKTIFCETINLDEKEITDIQKEEREIKDEIKIKYQYSTMSTINIGHFKKVFKIKQLSYIKILLIFFFINE